MSSNKEWSKAIAACVKEFDTNVTLREIWKKEDAEYLQDHAGDRKLSHLVPTRPESAFVDPVQGLHPPATLLAGIRKARQRLAEVSASADIMKEESLREAEKADSPYEKQMARDKVSERFVGGTPEIKHARNELEEVLTKAGVYALSLRLPFTIREDTSRTSRKNDADELELFETALQHTRDYPSQTRRALHNVRTTDERRLIHTKTRSDCRAKLGGAKDRKEQSARELQAKRNAQQALDIEIDRMGGVCKVCQWAHQKDLTKWANPITGEQLKVTQDKQRHVFLKSLHDGMAENNGGDVSLAKILKEPRRNGQQPKDILGDELLAALFMSTGLDRGQIKPPNFKRPSGRPRKQVLPPS
jgi:hypothetical protein